MAPVPSSPPLPFMLTGKQNDPIHWPTQIPVTSSQDKPRHLTSCHVLQLLSEAVVWHDPQKLHCTVTPKDQIWWQHFEFCCWQSDCHNEIHGTKSAKWNLKNCFSSFYQGAKSVCEHKMLSHIICFIKWQHKLSLAMQAHSSNQGANNLGEAVIYHSLHDTPLDMTECNVSSFLCPFCNLVHCTQLEMLSSAI